MQNALDLPRPHTLRSIAEECGEKKDAVKYAYRKLNSTLGLVVDGVRHFSDGEATEIIVCGGFQRKTDFLEGEIIDPGDPLATFDPLAVSQQGKDFTPSDDTEVIDLGNRALATLHQQSQANRNSGLGALIQHRRNRGRKLGVMLAQVEIGAAIQESDRLVGDFLEGEGIGTTPKSSDATA